MTISVMIATRNRCEELQRTCDVLSKMVPLPDEVIICADGCSDKTVETVTQKFPHFRLLINQEPQGSVPSRVRMLREVKGDVVVSLDDDSYPMDKVFFGRLPEVMNAHPEAAVVTFPEVRDEVDPRSTKTPQSPGHYVSAYPNCSAAMRRDFYLRSPGFPPFFGHMYEETDYGLQCYAGGKAVWFEPSCPIRHHLSNSQRQPIPRHHQNARNELWSVWMRCPWPWLPVVSFYRIIRQFQYSVSEGLGWVAREPVWWFQAIKGLPKVWKVRQPVPWDRYIAWVRLARNPVFKLEELKQVFPGVKAE